MKKYFIHLKGKLYTILLYTVNYIFYLHHNPVLFKCHLLHKYEVKLKLKILSSLLCNTDPTVHTEALTVHLPQGVCHASLVSHEGGQVDRVAGVVFRPCLHPPPVPLAPLAGQEPHVPVARGMKFTMRLKKAQTTNT